jgi:predicted nucleic acid-binding protein
VRNEEAVLCHRFVVGELACGALNSRIEILGLLRNLTQAPVVEHEEVFAFVQARGLMGSGLGWVDVHLLASATLAGERFWTRDRRLAQVARRLGVAAWAVSEPKSAQGTRDPLNTAVRVA